MLVELFRWLWGLVTRAAEKDPLYDRLMAVTAAYDRVMEQNQKLAALLEQRVEMLEERLATAEAALETEKVKHNETRRKAEEARRKADRYEALVVQHEAELKLLRERVADLDQRSTGDNHLQ